MKNVKIKRIGFPGTESEMALSPGFSIPTLDGRRVCHFSQENVYYQSKNIIRLNLVS